MASVQIVIHFWRVWRVLVRSMGATSRSAVRRLPCVGCSRIRRSPLGKISLLHKKCRLCWFYESYYDLCQFQAWKWPARLVQLGARDAARSVQVRPRVSKEATGLHKQTDAGAKEAEERGGDLHLRICFSYFVIWRNQTNEYFSKVPLPSNPLGRVIKRPKVGTRSPRAVYQMLVQVFIFAVEILLW